MSVTFKQTTLDNGMTILAEIDPAAHSAAAGFFVKAGARDEQTSLMGVSHYLEHMMFKGTDDLDADAINRGFDDIGASNDAYTSREMTCFYAHVIPEKLSAATNMLGLMMRPALRNSDFDTEKNVILEEIAMYADNPFWVLYEACVERHYAAHGLAHRVLGTPESVAAMTRDSMEDYFNTRYSADNTVVALAGKLDFDACVEQISTLCGSWKQTNPPRNTNRPTTAKDPFTLHDERVNRGYLFALCDAPSVTDDRRYAAALLAQVLGGADNSRLHWALIETGLAEEAQAAYDGLDGCGDFFLYASGDPDKLDDIWDTISSEIKGLKDSLQESDLEKLRSKMVTASTLGSERPSDRMQRLGRLWTMTGKYMPLEEELALIGLVRVDDLRAICDEFPFDACTLGKMLPAESTD
ncbi:MAG: insulinase family protein [Phycisphaerales bacterium]|nr:insulinase family protein [Phycisphaerales bacterium]